MVLKGIRVCIGVQCVIWPTTSLRVRNLPTSNGNGASSQDSQNSMPDCFLRLRVALAKPSDTTPIARLFLCTKENPEGLELPNDAQLEPVKRKCCRVLLKPVPVLVEAKLC
jgi:hypothetical protein